MIENSLVDKKLIIYVCTFRIKIENKYKDPIITSIFAIFIPCNINSYLFEGVSIVAPQLIEETRHNAKRLT